MLTRLTARNFKSLGDVTIELPRLAVLFGPNGAGKSNLIDAIQALSWMGNSRTLFDALGGQFPIRGHAFESFSFAAEGLQALLQKGAARFSLDADLQTAWGQYQYRVEPEIDFKSGQLCVADEFLAQLSMNGNVRGNPIIEKIGNQLRIRRKGKLTRRHESIGLNHTILSDQSLSGDGYPWLDQVRAELINWRTYYFEPRMSMRNEVSPADVYDVGIHGEYIAPFLYKLQAQQPKYFDAVSRTLKSVIPSVEALSVWLDEQRGTLNLSIQQSGVDYSARVLSEGTLRVLALCAIAVNPWGGVLVALEEPENGVHPRRLELIAQLLLSLTTQNERQLIVTTHSPLFVDAMLKAKRESTIQHDIGLFNVRRDGIGTVIEPFYEDGPLFRESVIEQALESGADDGRFESLLMRGFIDE